MLKIIIGFILGTWFGYFIAAIISMNDEVEE